MAKHQLNSSMTEGFLPKQIVFFSLPLMLSNVLQVLFNMSDVAVVGRFAGSHALGAVGSTSILVSLLTTFLIGIGTGVNIMVARFLGARQDRETSLSVHTSFLICAASGLLLMGFSLLCARPVLELLGTKEELIGGAETYLRIYSLGLPAAAMYNFGNAVLSAAGDTRRPLYILSIAGVLNVLLNLLFVIVFHMAEAGVALASTISQCMSAALVLILLFRSSTVYALHLSLIKLDTAMAKRILPLSLSAAAQNAIFAVANLFIQSGVNSFDTVIVEGTAAATNADALCYDVMAAFYTACSSFMSQNYGAGKRKRVLQSYLISLGFSFAVGAVIGLALEFFGLDFLALFTTDAAVADAVMMRLRVMGFSYAFSAFMDCTIAASRGLGKSVVPTIIVVLGSCVFRVIWVYTIFAYFHTILSLYLLYIFSWSITAIAEIAYFVHIFRRTELKAPLMAAVNS